MNSGDIELIREFNRFYTKVLGLLDQHLLHSPYSLPEARILYELYHQQPCTASAIMATVEMDKGYLSRVLALFTRKGLLTKKKSQDDGRATFLSLTVKGNSEFEKINQASVDQIKTMVKTLSGSEQLNLVKHMKSIQEILNSVK
ncbi:MAG TPA: MarR family winged helix-turn-helix transcriptional regulator [Cyclobacteriaceae bacterium]